MAFSGLGLENVVGFDVLERYLFTKASVAVLILIPRGSIYTTIMELGPERPIPIMVLGT